MCLKMGGHKFVKQIDPELTGNVFFLQTNLPFFGLHVSTLHPNDNKPCPQAERAAADASPHLCRARPAGVLLRAADRLPVGQDEGDDAHGGEFPRVRHPPDEQCHFFSWIPSSPRTMDVWCIGPPAPLGGWTHGSWRGGLTTLPKMENFISGAPPRRT